MLLLIGDSIGHLQTQGNRAHLIRCHGLPWRASMPQGVAGITTFDAVSVASHPDGYDVVSL
jgi:hypothetical protein